MNPCMHLSRLRVIDLSVPLEHDAVSEPLPAAASATSATTARGSQQMQQFFGVRPEDLVYSGGQGWAVEEVQAITHTGTHVDAPYHYGADVRGPARRGRIDEVPLEWCFAPGVVLDVRHKAAGDFITVDRPRSRPGHDRLSAAAAGHRAACTPGPTSGSARRDYFAQPGLGREGVLWLVEQGVRVIGIDAYTLDRPFASMVADYQRTGDGRYIWPAHFAGITREYCQIEKLANLDQIPRPHGFYVSCLPVKIAGASAGWCRAVALVPEAEE